MKVRAYYDHWLPRLIGMGAVTVYPFVFFALTRDDRRLPDLVRHEAIHVRQTRRQGWLSSNLLYLFEYVAGRFKGLTHMQAYLQISAEVEAYREERTVVLTPEEWAEFGFDQPPA
jgi:hypothetical protein